MPSATTLRDSSVVLLGNYLAWAVILEARWVGIRCVRTQEGPGKSEIP